MLKHYRNANHKNQHILYNGGTVRPGRQENRKVRNSGTTETTIGGAFMAHRIQAVNAYRPRIERGNTVQKPEWLRSASRSTSLVEGTIDLSIKELRDQINDCLF